MKNKFLLTTALLFFSISSCNNSNDEVGELTLTASRESGFYKDDFFLKLSTSHKADIYYTVDGSEPNKNSYRYINGINILKNNQDNKISNIKNISTLDDIYFPDFKVDKSITIKAFATDRYGNQTSTINLKYFIGLEEEYYKGLPIVCLDTDKDNLFDYEKGIYVTGKTYDEGEKVGTYKEEYPANYNNSGKEWEREAHLSYFDKDHKFSFEQDIGIRIHGGWTRAFAQKSFNLYARKEYSGSNTFEKPFFNTNKLKTCMLRSGGYRDHALTKVRDILNQEISIGMNFETEQGYPVITFLNGEYWGIYNLQERFSDSYIEEHYGIDKDNVIIIEKDELDEGKETDMSLYNDMISFFRNTDFSNDDNYELAKDIIDIKGFMEYMSTELIIGNVDWPNNNFRMWRSREIGKHTREDNKWRFMMYDTDDSCGIIDKCSPDSNPFENSSHWVNGPLDSGCTIGLIFTSLLNNQSFSDEFKETFIDILNNRFSSEIVDQKLGVYTSLLKKPMEKYYTRFVSGDSCVNSNYFEDLIKNISIFFLTRDYTYLTNL